MQRSQLSLGGENHSVSLSCSNILREMVANYDNTAHHSSVDIKIQDEEEKIDESISQNNDEYKWILPSLVHFS